MGSDFATRTQWRAWNVSIHAPRMGSDRFHPLAHYIVLCFNPRSPHGERRPSLSDLRRFYNVSIHAPRMGSDSVSSSLSIMRRWFQSTLPAWGATIGRFTSVLHTPGFNPRSPHGERLLPGASIDAGVAVSIHAPRMGSDVVSFADNHDDPIVSIHAPRMGSDQ